MGQNTLSPQDPATVTLKEEYLALLKGMDRLLTIGSYYQPSHERFQAVARQCVLALRDALDGRDTLEILFTTEGISIDEGKLPASAPEAKRLFDLLDPLHVAMLEISSAATSDHLHLALASLKKARTAITNSLSYQEITIKGLPETVRAVNRTLYLKTKGLDRPPAPKKPREKKPEVNFFNHNIISDLLLSGSQQGQKLEKEFVGIIQGIMATADPTKLKNSGDGAAEPEDWLPDETLDAIEKVLESLSGTGSDLMNLQHLIAQAQTAMEMTGDPQLVDLVFSRLQKDSRKLARKRVQPKMIGKDQKGTRTSAKNKLIMSLQEMRDIVDSLEVPLGPMADPQQQAAADCLSICVQLMDLAPSEELVTGIEETAMRLVAVPRLTASLKEGLVRVSRALLISCSEEVQERTWPMIWGPLLRSHPQQLSSLWYDLWRDLPSRGRLRAWPYLVNDLLLGMPAPDRIQHLLLLEALSQVEALGNHEVRVVLENLQALSEGTMDPGFLTFPPPLLYSVHKVLIGCSCSATFGPTLHDSLVKQAPHKLSSILLEIMDEYQPTNRAVYQAILDQGIEERIHPDLAELAPEIIQDALDDLHWDYMEEDWVIPAISWLGELGNESSLPVLRDIILEKKYKVLNSWPHEAREAAAEALDLLQARLEYRGQESPENPDPETQR